MDVGRAFIDKDAELHALVERLSRDLKPQRFDILDHWAGDRRAVGLAKRDEPGVLLYVSLDDSEDEAFSYECEWPPADPEFPYDSDEMVTNASYTELLNAARVHLLGGRQRGAMKWFTRDFLAGGLDDVEWRRRIAGYTKHLDDLQPRLSRGAQILASALSLHDASVKSWEYDAGRFRMTLVIGDLQVGYEWVELAYVGAELINATTADLVRWPIDECTIGDDEIDETADGHFEHRILFWPKGQLGIRFEELQVVRKPATPHDWAGSDA